MTPAHSPTLRSIRRSLLVVVVLLGVCVFLLGDIASATRGYSTMVSAAGKLVGGVTALSAFVLLFQDLSREASSGSEE